MRCCGKDYESSFCPDCGKQLREKNPLDELLCHIRNTAHRMQLGVEERGGASWGRSAKKWKRWRDAYEKLYFDSKK